MTERFHQQETPRLETKEDNIGVLRNILFLSLLLPALTCGSFAQIEKGVSRISEAEVAATPEYRAAKTAEKAKDGASMLIQAKNLVERFPASPLAHKSMSDAYYYMNFLDEAAASARKAIELAPKDTIAWRNLGRIFEQQRKPEDALNAYKNAVNAGQSDPIPWSNLATFYRETEKYDLALKCAQQALALLKATQYNDHNGESPEEWVWDEIGMVFFACERFSDAVTYHKKAISIRPNNASTWAHLAFAYRGAGDDANALSAAKQALKLDPEHELAKSALQAFTSDAQSAPAGEQKQIQPLIRLTNIIYFGDAGESYLPEGCTLFLDGEETGRYLARTYYGRQVSIPKNLAVRLSDAEASKQNEIAPDLLTRPKSSSERYQERKTARDAKRQTPAEANQWWQNYQLQEEIRRLRR